MNDTLDTSPSPTRRARATWPIWIIVLLALGLAGWRGWLLWQARHAQEAAQLTDAEQRLQALEGRLDNLRQDQRAQTQRIQDAANTNRVLRDEVLGLSQRGALLEESVAKLADSTRSGAQALKLDEVELLLSQASLRISLAQDLAGARRAYALAAQVLEGIDDPRLLNLKQALAQERSAIDALGEGPQAVANRELDAVAKALAQLPLDGNVDPDPAHRPTWQRLLAPLVDIRPARTNAVVTPNARSTGEAALQVEISLARAALERGDDAGFDAALDRVLTWLPRLWPASVERDALARRIVGLQQAPLRVASPTLDSTLQQLHALRRTTVAPPPALLPPSENTP